MTHWRTVNPSPYLAAVDLDGKDVVVTIASVTPQEVTLEGGRKEVCRVAQLSSGGKPCGKAWLINSTNSKVLDAMAKSGQMEAWAGLTVTLYPTTTKMKKETVPCIRVRHNKD